MSKAIYCSSAPFIQDGNIASTSELWGINELQVCMLSHFSGVRPFATLWTLALQAPLSVRFSKARILEWVATAFSRGSSWPRNQTHISYVSCWQVGSLPLVPPGKPNKWVSTCQMLRTVLAHGTFSVFATVFLLVLLFNVSYSANNFLVGSLHLSCSTHD